MASARPLAALLVAGVMLLHSPAQAQTEEKNRLEQIKGEISGLTRKLGQSQRERERLIDILRELDTRIHQTSRALRESQAKEKELQAALEQLGKKQRALTARVEEHRQTLARYTRQRYLAGEHGYLKLFLTQTDPANLNRTLTYYHYLNQAHAGEIDRAKTELQALEDIKQETVQRQTELRDTQAELAAQKVQLMQEQQTRRPLLAALNSEITDRQSRLRQLTADAKALENIIRELQRQKTAPAATTTGAGKGRLPWPVQGRLLASFGQPRGLGSMKWDGALIAAAEGTPVKAIAAGKVVYADWLRGYGLLIILDHGDGTLSLYGQNQSLQKQLGEAVSQSEVIAHVGNSGGGQESGLYFEVRHNGKPVDPAHWCRGSRPG
ncbi:MAG: peptidoglycan DD-metalloendopeptidase family protein [Pseudomonadota bacterium]